MKARSFFAILVSLIFFVGCSVNHQLNGVTESSTLAKKSVITFSSLSTVKALAKTKVIGDSLTVAQRVALLDSLIARVKIISVVLKRVNEPGTNWDYAFAIPVSGGAMNYSAVIDSGDYTIIGYDCECVAAGPDTIYAGSTFQTEMTVSIGKTDTTIVNLELQRKEDFPVEIEFVSNVGDTLNGSLDSLDKSVIGDNSPMPVVKNNFLYAYVFPVKKSFSFYFNGKKYSGLFDISKISGNVVKVPCSTPPILGVQVSFADKDSLTVVSVSPISNSPSGFQAVWVNFNHYLSDVSQMPKLSFAVYSANDTTVNLAVNVSAENLSLYCTANLQPNTEYFCSVANVIDEYGHILKSYQWSFTTGAN
jgi:hypothetical protein